MRSSRSSRSPRSSGSSPNTSLYSLDSSYSLNSFPFAFPRLLDDEDFSFHPFNYKSSLMSYQNVQPPAGGKITIQDGKIQCPNNPVIPFIRGDGTGPDIWAASERVFDAAVQKAYGGV